MSNLIEFKDFSIFYDQHIVLNQLSLGFKQGQWTAILGRSGCGKSSLLKAISGSLNDTKHTSGKLKIAPNAAVAYMSQCDSLLPWLTVMDNILLHSKLHRIKPNKHKALELLERIGLAKYANSYPHILSGGMRQRVALARTLMQDHPIILMDEPFASLDAFTRREIHQLCKEMLQSKTLIIVTHDPAEALYLTDHIYIMQQQQLHQVNLPLDTLKKEEALLQHILQKGHSNP